MNPLLLQPALDLVSKVLDRVIPDKAQAEKAKAEYALLVAKQDQDEVDSFRKFVVAVSYTHLTLPTIYSV